MEKEQKQKQKSGGRFGAFWTGCTTTGFFMSLAYIALVHGGSVQVQLEKSFWQEVKSFGGAIIRGVASLI